MQRRQKVFPGCPAFTFKKGVTTRCCYSCEIERILDRNDKGFCISYSIQKTCFPMHGLHAELNKVGISKKFATEHEIS